MSKKTNNFELNKNKSKNNDKKDKNDKNSNNLTTLYSKTIDIEINGKQIINESDVVINSGVNKLPGRYSISTVP